VLNPVLLGFSNVYVKSMIHCMPHETNVGYLIVTAAGQGIQLVCLRKFTFEHAISVNRLLNERKSARKTADSFKLPTTIICQLSAALAKYIFCSITPNTQLQAGCSDGPLAFW
jgi:hypothetical protein